MAATSRVHAVIWDVEVISATTHYKYLIEHSKSMLYWQNKSSSMKYLSGVQFSCMLRRVGLFVCEAHRWRGEASLHQLWNYSPSHTEQFYSLMMKDYVKIICRHVKEIIHSSWKVGGGVILMQRETLYSRGFIPSVVYCLSYRCGECGNWFQLHIYWFKRFKLCYCFFKYMCIQSADATVSISSNFKAELIRMNLYLMKLLAFLLAETHWHLILNLTGSYIFYFFYNTLWTFFRHVKGLYLIHDIKSDLAPYESTSEPLSSNLLVKMPWNLN